jgi:hypothetical protein
MKRYNISKIKNAFINSLEAGIVCQYSDTPWAGLFKVWTLVELRFFLSIYTSSETQLASCKIGTAS